jgi:multiple sugar transport system permease protein
MRTIPIGLGVFVHQRGMKYDLLMAASVMAILPMLIVFFSAQKNFIEGITLTGMKS